MRDFILTGFIAVLLTLVFKHPVMGAYVWAWLGLMNPHKLTYGFAFELPFAQATAALTLLSLLMTRKRQRLPMNGVVIVFMLFLFWMTVTSVFAMNTQEIILERWIFVMKMQVMLLVTWILVVDKTQLRTLIWVVTMSVCFFGIKGGVWTLATGGGGRVWGPPGGMLQGNNELAVALVMLMPMLYFLRQTESRRWVRYFLLFAMVSTAFSILGSQSRGALLSLLAMAFFLGLKGKSPVRTTLLLAVFVVLAISFMPDSWSDRMETVRTYQADSSAMSRIWTWNTLWNAALDRPLVGVGFRADSSAVFNRYANLDGEFAVFAGSVYVAHSIYFQVLGEHGFVGLGLFLLIGIWTWLTAGRIARRTKDDLEFGPWVPLLMRMVQVSLIAYAVGGAFLSLAYLDLPYYIIGFVVLADAQIKRSAAAHRSVMSPVAARHELGVKAQPRQVPP